MREGKIIKLYREKLGMTQEQLGNGICSVTHISKIERGITEYSSEIIMLLSKRLNINLDEEIIRFNGVNNILHRWLDSMVREEKDRIEEYAELLEKEPLVLLSDYKNCYQLIKAWYFLTKGSLDDANKIIKSMKKEKLPKFEENLFKHISGLYLLLIGEVNESIRTLKTIDPNIYHNPEYFYHLGIAYHYKNSNVLAYYYADKAIQHFQKTKNIIKIIDCELLMLSQIPIGELNGDFDEFYEFYERYEHIIKNCNMIQNKIKKSKALNNLAYVCYRMNLFEKAVNLYNESMELKEANSQIYLISLYGYVNSCLKGNLIDRFSLLEAAHRGLQIAKTIKDESYQILFKLFIYKVNNKTEQYFHYLRTKALPYYSTYPYVKLEMAYIKELFEHFITTSKNDDALLLAKEFIRKAPVEIF
ncbi:helix-turn-helix domain-containing protein [Cytobacillus dafuensis]|uniref:Helix-turn-helix transcriptional regulator n=1 Tax=Cytobacillus dafuensis TaxID=1742359 RepID=A0A5B8Z5E6_CYTDA|nr:helix-turn-helix transcriptional regulator [Cytobacillus dafuensis]QED48138.1 helix-turn-helix transcriptional regulator [Cytobacillus dafuensis]